MRVLFILFVSAVGMIGALSNSFYGILLYAFYSLASPMDLVYWSFGFSGANMSFLVAAVTILTRIKERCHLIIFDRTTVFAFLFLVVCGISLSVNSNVSSYAWNRLWLLTRILIMMFVTASLVDNLQKLKIYIVAVVVFTGLLGAYYGFTGLAAGSTWITGPGSPGGGRFGDNNGYAVWLNTSLPFMFYLGQNMKNKFWNAFLKVVFIGNVIAIMLTFSRAGNMTLIFSLAVMTLMSRRKAQEVAFLAAVIIFLVAVIIPKGETYRDDGSYEQQLEAGGSNVTSIMDAYQDRMETVADYPQVGTAQSRMYFWGVALSMAAENPLFGVGFMRFQESYDDYDRTGGMYGDRRAVHNTFCEVVAGTGYVGFGLFMMLILTVFLNTGVFVRWLKEELPEHADEFTGYANMIRISMVVYCIGSMFVTTVFFDIFWNLIAISSAMAAIAGAKAVAYDNSMKWEKFIWEKL